MTIMPIQQVMTMASAILSQGQASKRDIPALTERVTRLNRAVDFWNGWMMAGLVIAAIAALWLALTTRLTIVRQRELALAQGELDSAKEGQLQLQLSLTEARRIAFGNRILDIFGPRQLTVAQSSEIVRKLAGLQGTKIDVYVEDIGDPPDSPEFKDSVKTALAVLRILDAAHMNAEGWVMNSCQGGHAEALNVTIASIASDNDRKIAQKVLDSFPHELGAFSVVQNGSPAEICTQFSDLDKNRPNKRKPDATISITIGRKINPLLTREMLESPGEQNEP